MIPEVVEDLDRAQTRLRLEIILHRRADVVRGNDGKRILAQREDRRLALVLSRDLCGDRYNISVQIRTAQMLLVKQIVSEFVPVFECDVDRHRASIPENRYLHLTVHIRHRQHGTLRALFVPRVPIRRKLRTGDLDGDGVRERMPGRSRKSVAEFLALDDVIGHVNVRSVCNVECDKAALRNVRLLLDPRNLAQLVAEIEEDALGHRGIRTEQKDTVLLDRPRYVLRHAARSPDVSHVLISTAAQLVSAPVGRVRLSCQRIDV